MSPAERPRPSERQVSPGLLPLGAATGPDGQLLVAGVDLAEIAEEFGTPVFVYDEDHLRARCREAVAAFAPRDPTVPGPFPPVAYATKAFLCKAMARVALEEGCALDVSTGGELAVALAAGASGRQLVLHGNNKSEAELEAALDAGVGRIVVDSFDEIARLSRLAHDRPPGLSGTGLVVRVTPGVEAHTHEYVMTGQEDTKFGFSVASGAADMAFRHLGEAGLAPIGVHAHIGSQIFEPDPYRLALEVLAPFAERHRVTECCIGGGLGVAYVEGEHAPSITEWADGLRSAAAAAGLPTRVQLTAEPGRAIVATAGVTLYRVGTVKVLPGLRTYVALDGGMSDNPRPVLYGSGYEAFLPREVGAARPLAVRLVGKHCETGDVVVDDARLPADLAVGDVVATPVTGAYGFSMASNYNKVPRPPVVFVSSGSARLVVRRETLQDLLACEV